MSNIDSGFGNLGGPAERSFSPAAQGGIQPQRFIPIRKSSESLVERMPHLDVKFKPHAARQPLPFDVQPQSSVPYSHLLSSLEQDPECEKWFERLDSCGGQDAEMADLEDLHKTAPHFYLAGLINGILMMRRSMPHRREA